jgi:hypothetical protein
MAKIDRLGWAEGIAVITYGHRIGIRVSESGALERLTASLPTDWKPAARRTVECMYSFVVGGSDGPRTRRFNLLYRDAQRIARSHDLEEVIAAFEGDFRLHVATSSRARLFVHAGVVGWRGGAIVLPGRSLAGKSTLVDALVKAGATYYSDEYAVFDSQGRVHPFARPLKLRAREGEAAPRATADPSALRVGKRPIPVRLVALTHYVPGESWKFQPLSPGQAMLALMESAVPVRYRPEATMQTLREIVTRVPVIQGVRGEVEEAVEKLLVS